MRISRRTWLVGSAAAASLQSRTQVRRPNLVVILADDLGYGDLSAYGSADLRTPHIDGLIAAGVRFDRFYANSPVCSPTRAALLTGRFSDRAGVPGVIRTDPANSWGYLTADAPLLPEVLGKAGYHTAIVGKWHLGLEAPNLPHQRGFQHSHAYLGDMMDDYWTHRRHGRNYMRLGGEEIDPKGHATDLFTTWAVEYLNARRGSPRQPFFLYLPYNAPHDPVQPPPQWLDKVKKREAGITEKRAALVALIEHMDDGVGKVVAALKANGQWENTLVVFTSDNGGLLAASATNGPLRGGKQDMYEGGIRVPACLTWAGNRKLEAGSRTQRVGMAMDLYPTLCEAAGVKPPAGIDGISLLSADQPERLLVWVRREGGPQYLGRDYYAIRKGDWKLVQNRPFQPYELYDLASDPGEKANVIGTEVKVARELQAALSLHLQRAASVPWQSGR